MSINQTDQLKQKMIESWWSRTLPMTDLDDPETPTYYTDREDWIDSVTKNVERLIDEAYQLGEVDTMKKLIPTLEEAHNALRNTKHEIRKDIENIINTKNI